MKHNNFKKLLLKNKLLVFVVLAGLFLRTYKPLELFMYSHDQDLLSWFVKDVVVNHNLRLIGQETSVHGVFIGPLFYYLMIPFYILFRMSPASGIIFVTLIGVFTIVSVYFVFGKIWGKRVSTIGAFIYSLSFYTIFTDREVVPTTPVILWSVWFLYAIYLISTGKQKFGFLISGILVGLIWHLNVALVLLLPLLVLALLFSGKRINLKDLFWPVIAMLIIVSPFLVFELRHGFGEVRAVVTQFESPPVLSQSKAEKFDRVIQLFEKNLGSVWGTSIVNIPRRPVLYLLPTIALFLLIKKKIDAKMFLLLMGWICLFLIFFTFNSLNVSEYYLNGTVVVFVAVLSIFLDYLFNNKYIFWLGLFFTFVYGAVNIKAFFETPVNESGFVERSAIVNEIKLDAVRNGYPCVAISYITSPGNDLGYRYLIYTEHLKTAPVSSLAPVYTIVFPLSFVDRTDKNFGVLGLIYPSYGEYTKEGIKKSCDGSDWNISQPLFGFVE